MKGSKREERILNEKDEEFAKELAMDLSDNEKEYLLVLHAVRKTLEYKKKQN